MNKLIKHGGGALREDKSNKINYTLIPPKMLERLAIRYTEGGKVHGNFNRLKGDEKYMNNMKDSAMRHFMQRVCGREDEDHMSAVVRNLFSYETLKLKLQGKLDKYLQSFL